MTNFLDYFSCPKCQNELLGNEQHIGCHSCEYALKNEQGVWFTTSKQNKNYASFVEFDGTNLRERAQTNLSTSRFEYLTYEKVLRHALELCQPNELVLELGAGDGRFTDILIKDHPVIANDINANGLIRLKQSVSNPKNLFCLCCSFDDLPIKKRSIQIITAIECLCYANENYEDTVKQLSSYLVPSGVFMDSEPLCDGAISYSLANGDFDAANLCVREKRKIEQIGECAVKSRVFQNFELQKTYADNNLKIVYEERTPEIACLTAFFYGQNKENFSTETIVNFFNNYHQMSIDNGRCQITITKLDL